MITATCCGRIYDCAAYACSTSKQHNLQTAVENAKSKGKKVTSRSIPKLTLGLESLEVAVGFKEAFCELEQIDSDFQRISLTKEEWDDAEAMYVFLKELNDSACSLLESQCHTANVVFPKICDIYLKLLVSERIGIDVVCEIASRSVARFLNICWCNQTLVLAIAVFLDARFKMDIIERWHRKIYSDGAAGHLKEIVDGVSKVYREYLNAASEMLDEFGLLITLSEAPDLDLYLKDSKLPSFKEFDILNWWHLNTLRYNTRKDGS